MLYACLTFRLPILEGEAMNVINSNRKLRHSQERVTRLEARRQAAKDKVRWDKRNGEVLSRAKLTLLADRDDLENLLEKQGYYRWAQ